MINCLLSSPLPADEKISSNSVLLLQRKWTGIISSLISGSVTDALENTILLPMDIHDCLEKTHFEPSVVVLPC